MTNRSFSDISCCFQDLISQGIERIDSEGLLLERPRNCIKALCDVREQFGELIMLHMLSCSGLVSFN